MQSRNREHTKRCNPMRATTASVAPLSVHRRARAHVPPMTPRPAAVVRMNGSTASSRTSFSAWVATRIEMSGAPKMSTIAPAITSNAPSLA
jgi:hypothetical protein